MNVMDALLRIAVCWKQSTDENINMNDLIAVSVDSFGDISFCMLEMASVIVFVKIHV